MNDEWLETVMELMAQIVITVYSKEEKNHQDILDKLSDIEYKEQST